MVEMTQMSINGQIDKQIMIKSYNEMHRVLSTIEEWSTNIWGNIDELWLRYAEWKKPVTKDDIFMTSFIQKSRIRNRQR